MDYLNRFFLRNYKVEDKQAENAIEDEWIGDIPIIIDKDELGFVFIETKNPSPVQDDDNETIPSREATPEMPPPPPLKRQTAEIRSICRMKEDKCFCYVFNGECKGIKRLEEERRKKMREEKAKSHSQ